MEQSKTQNYQDQAADVRETYSARLLSNSQFDEAVAITSIIEREILRSGTFKEKLADYAHAFARTEKFDSGKAETMIRDIFRSRVGQSMNDMREKLMQREETLTPQQKTLGVHFAKATGEMIETGDKITFSRAFAHQGELLGRELGITDAGAKRLMKEEFQAVEGADFYQWGKDIEETFYRSQIEAERQRGQARQEGRESEPNDEPSREAPRRRETTRSDGDSRRSGPSSARTPSRSRMELRR